jgi:hypothetical protein
MNNNNNAADRETLLAEYGSLRTEILQRSNMQWNIFALQLTAAGVVFSFALSNPSHTGFLLILPVVSYVLAGRYGSQSLGIQKAALYIREVLEVKTGGELNWETWNRSKKFRDSLLRSRSLTWLNPLLLAFSGVSVVALAWVAPYVWESREVSTGKRVLLVIVWLVGIVVTALSVQLINRIVSKHWRGSWRQAVNRLSVKRTKSPGPGGVPPYPGNPSVQNLPGTGSGT